MHTPSRLAFAVMVAALVAWLPSAMAQTAVLLPNWALQSPDASPQARGQAMMVYDAAAKQVVLFGGVDIHGNFLADTWTWDGSAWTQQSTANSPSARCDAMMAYDAATRQVILFGGGDTSGFLNDTWAWDGSKWTQVSSSGPSVRVLSTMAYDAVHQQVVLFGGFTTSFNMGNTYLNDTWVWNGSSWTQAGPVHDPPARTEATMVYDSAQQEMVLFGGVDRNDVDLNDTWTWNGTDWTQQTPATSPPGRLQAAMAYDTALGEAVLFGGVGTSGEFDDSWTWNGSNWTQQEPLTSPPLRTTAMMADFPPQQQVVLFGGGNIDSNALNDTWTFQLPGNLGATNVCPAGSAPPSCGVSGTVAFRFTTAATDISPSVVTQGATGLDFTDARTGTCYLNGTSYTYNPGDVCTVNVNFTPKYAGVRDGAVELLNSSGNAIATAYLYGTGQGPQLTLGWPSAGLKLGSGFDNPGGVAVDGNGNVYVADTYNFVVKKIPPECTSSSCTTTVGGGFSLPFGLAVDGAGNVYVADYGDNAVKKIPPGCTSSACVITLGGGFSTPADVAVDGNGDAFVADPGNKAVKEIPAGCGSSSCVTTIDGGFYFNSPWGIAVDGIGNVYVADPVGSWVVEIPAGCVAANCVKPIAGFDGPLSVAVDGSGDIYVGDESHQIWVMPPGCLSSNCVTTLGGGFNYPEDIAVDGSGNVYAATQGGWGSGVYELNLSTPPSLIFPNTNVGTQSTAAPPAATLMNIGNEPLTFPVPASGQNPSVSANFTLDALTTCPEVTPEGTPGTLAAHASCQLLVDFVPTATGLISGSLTLTDNTLNVANSTQSIALTGIGVSTSLITPTVTVTLSSSSIPTTQSLSVTVVLSGGNGNPTPTGSVILSGGGYTSAATTLTAGSTVITIPAGQLTPGPETLAATYYGDQNYNSASGSNTVFVTQAIGSCSTANPNPNPNPASFANPGDFDGDCKSDILWHNISSGEDYIWLMNGTASGSQASPGAVDPSTGWTIAGVGDFNGDGQSDILWRNTTTGQLYTWLMNGTSIGSQASPGTVAPATGWTIAGVGDFDGDGKADILWRNTTTGQLYVWLMNGTASARQASPGTVGRSTGWTIAGVGDFNGDGKADILWQNSSTGQLYIWLMNGTASTSQGSPGTVGPSSGWTIMGVGDFNGDSMSDILWQNTTTGQLYLWLMNGTSIASQASPGTVAPSSGWSIQGVGDYNGDGKADILWRNSTTGEVYVWLMNGTATAGQGSLDGVSADWQIADTRFP